MRRFAVCLLAGALLILASSARADDIYTVDSCATATGAAAGSAGWTVAASASAFQQVGCPRPGVVTGETRGAVPSLGGSNATFTAPAATRIVAYRLWRSARLNAGWNYSLYRTATTGRSEDLVETCWPISGCSSVGDANVAPPADVTEARIDIPALVLHMDCNNGNQTSCPGGGTSNVTAHRLQVDLADRVDPVLTGTPSGDLVDTTRPISGVRTVSFSASDQGSGVYLARVEVDGTTRASSAVDSNEGRCAKPFRYPVPCRSTASGSLSVDTAQLVDGTHSVRLVVTDATETNSVTFGPVQVTTANQSTACVAGNASELTARFASTRRSALTRRGGRALTLTGTAPPGATVLLLSREVRTGAPRIVTSNATADAAGAFRLAVPAGRSRTLRVAYRTTPTDPVLRCSRTLRLRVPARVTLAARRTAVRRFRLSGRLLGGAVPARGKVVELQGFENGRWRVFRTTRSRSSGRFATTYGFKAASTGRSFRLRVRVRADASYPFSVGYSRVVRIRVR